jgi:aerobic carbon-monoxide dehydrogenase small subunit
VKQILTLRVNGETYEVAAEPHRTLLEVLREQMNFFGTKRGCDEGTCGSCTVLMDGKPVLSCLTLALDAQGRDLTTIEGVAKDGTLHAIQRAFIEKGAIQCGFCTPGMVITAKALLEKNPKPSEREIKQAISGNLCRCTGYVKIIDAIKTVAELNQEG